MATFFLLLLSFSSFSVAQQWKDFVAIPGNGHVHCADSPPPLLLLYQLFYCSIKLSLCLLTFLWISANILNALSVGQRAANCDTDIIKKKYVELALCTDLANVLEPLTGVRRRGGGAWLVGWLDGFFLVLTEKG